MICLICAELRLGQGRIGCKEKWQMSARKSLPLADRSLFSPFQHIFRTPLQDYSVLIHLHQRHLPRLEQGVDVTMATRDSAHKAHSHKMRRTMCSHLPVVDFDPAQQYHRELEVRMSSCLHPQSVSSASPIPRPHGLGMRLTSLVVFERYM